MKKSILLSVALAAATSISMWAESTLDDTSKLNTQTNNTTPTTSKTLDEALSAAQQAIADAYEAGYEAGKNEGTETGLAAGLKAGDLADGEQNLDDPDAVAAETVEVEKEMEELMNNPEKMDAIMKDPEFQSFLKEIESNPEMAKQLGIPAQDEEKSDENDDDSSY